MIEYNEMWLSALCQLHLHDEVNMDTPNRNDLQPQRGDALLIVDVQNDFLPGGSLAVPRGDDDSAALARTLTVLRAQVGSRSGESA